MYVPDALYPPTQRVSEDIWSSPYLLTFNCRNEKQKAKVSTTSKIYRESGNLNLANVWRNGRCGFIEESTLLVPQLVHCERFSPHLAKWTPVVPQLALPGLVSPFGPKHATSDIDSTKNLQFSPAD